MSLYNQIMGRNPHSPYLLGALGITQQTAEQYPLGRIRDVSTNDAADRIFILTRNYGEEWKHVDMALAKHPNFLRKYSESDETFSTYEFSVPEENQYIVNEISKLGDNTPPFQRYITAINDFGNGKQNAMTEHILEVGKKIMGPIKAAIDSGKSTVISLGDSDITSEHI